MARILLIDEDELSTRELSSGLQAQGYEVDCFRTAHDGLKQLRRMDYDVAIVDWRNRDMPGWEICRRCRFLYPTLPVVVLGSCDDVEDRIFALDAGAQDFLVKPFSLLELTARLRSLLRRYRRDKISAPESQPLPLPLPANVPVIK